MAFHAETVGGALCHGNFCVFFLMHIVAIRAHNTDFAMFACPPFVVLLVMFLLFPIILSIEQIEGFPRPVAV